MSRKVRTVELPEAAGFSCDVGFANCRSASLTLHGDARVIAGQCDCGAFPGGSHYDDCEEMERGE